MEKLEKVEMLREKTGVSYEDAKNALEACEYDMLDAIVYLEKLGKVAGPQATSYTTSSTEVMESESFSRARADYEEDCKRSKLGETVDKMVNWIGDAINKSWESKFVVYHHEEKAIEIPVLILIILLLCAFWIVCPLLVIGMFFDFKYHFVGNGKVTEELNEMCDKASDACVNVKDKKDGE